MENKKVIFKINVSNIISLITNSSSELFVLKGKTKEIVEEMIRDVYPNYKDEYELKSLDDMTPDNFDTYFSYAYRIGRDEKGHPESEYTLFDIHPSKLWKNWETRNEEKWWWADLTEEGAVLVREHFRKSGELFFLFSEDENPNWDMVELLEQIGSRYHLG